jgi:6-phosphogluconolactonase
VSGGSTPGLFFAALSRTDVDWGRVVVTLVDDRLVEETSPRSNAGLVKGRLLVGPAAAARFVPLCAGEGDAEEAAKAAEGRLEDIARPFSAVVLGMGADGHTASWFPGGDNLAAAIDPEGTRVALAMHAPGAGEPRVTLTLPFVLYTRLLALHIEGQEKLAVLGRALSPGPAAEMPIRAVLGQRQVKIAIYSSP